MNGPVDVPEVASRAKEIFSLYARRRQVFHQSHAQHLAIRRATVGKLLKLCLL